jgi:hypothetical protein
MVGERRIERRQHAPKAWMRPLHHSPRLNSKKTGATGASRTRHKRLCRPPTNRSSSVANLRNKVGANGWNRTTVTALRMRRTATVLHRRLTKNGARIGDRTRVTELATPCLTIRPFRKIKKATQRKLGGLEILTTLGVRLADTRAYSWRTARR